MKLAAFLAPPLAALLLAGCSTAAHREYGSWLDEVGRPAHPPLVMNDEQAGYMLQEAAQLRMQSEAVRARLASEADRRQRFRYYEELRALGDRLAPTKPLERLANAYFWPVWTFRRIEVTCHPRSHR